MYTRKADLGWAAGFIDGEGYFGYSTLSNGMAVQFATSQSGSPELLYKLQGILGCGKVTGPYKHSSGGSRKPIYRFAIYGKKVLPMMDKMYPLLGTAKQKQIDKVRSLY